MYSKLHYLRAKAHIRGSEKAPHLCGEVNFYQKRNGVLITANVRGLPTSNESGFLGFHIHEGSNCKGKDFSETKSHYNPNSAEHPMHAGDLPPLLSCSGKAYLSLLTNRFTINDIIGRTVVIHSKPDDFYTQPAGNAGEKIACGIICGI